MAFAGKSGSGKSTLVNTIRGLGPWDDGAAPVKISQTAHEPKRYPHPEHSNVDLWDLPGFGRYHSLRHIHVDQIEMERYDFFLLVSDGRFTESDI